mmetsp:Transcript_13364/g.32152  ORF Transcript_13364/g.32152 Transcript_13364/m.32152 type:complete len:236 (-) Transcript_13364:151-858(-)
MVVVTVGLGRWTFWTQHNKILAKRPRQRRNPNQKLPRNKLTIVLPFRPTKKTTMRMKMKSWTYQGVGEAHNNFTMIRAPSQATYRCLMNRIMPAWAPEKTMAQSPPLTREPRINGEKIRPTTFCLISLIRATTQKKSPPTTMKKLTPRKRMIPLETVTHLPLVILLATATRSPPMHHRPRRPSHRQPRPNLLGRPKRKSTTRTSRPKRKRKNTSIIKANHRTLIIPEVIITRIML